MGRYWTAPRCSTGKVGYRGQGHAIRAAQRMLAGARQEVAPAEAAGSVRGVYRCPECGAWHMTGSVGGTTVPLP